jgi:hypothetical protein
MPVTGPLRRSSGPDRKKAIVGSRRGAGKGHLPFHLLPSSQLAFHRHFCVIPLLKGKLEAL